MVVLLALFLARSAAAEVAGSTSRYVRRLAESVDLPYDSPYFSVPPGENPPQQVCCSREILCFKRDQIDDD